MNTTAQKKTPQLSAKTQALQDKFISLETELADTEKEGAGIADEINAANEAIYRLTDEQETAQAELDALYKDYPRLLAHVALGRATEDEKSAMNARMDTNETRLKEIDLAVAWLRKEAKRLEAWQLNSVSRIDDLQRYVRTARKDFEVRRMYDDGASISEFKKIGFSSSASLQAALKRVGINVQIGAF